jgi:hypothetical protein
MGDTHCDDCGALLKEYDIYDPDTFETEGTHTVCPNKWKTIHE